MIRMRMQQGVSLIEVLVSILVMALGLMGMASLQTATLKYQQGSVQRGMLAGLVSDFAERARANPSQSPQILGDDSPYLTESGLTWTDASGDVSDAPATDCRASTASCQAADVAEYDMTVWRQSVRAALPQGGAAVVRQGDALSLTLMWSDKDRISEKSPTCGDGDSSAESVSCCPASLGAPEGVRCANFVVRP
jgi:type IV pilus assembly protein PilV